MKLRIHGSALRLRLTQKDVAQLRDRSCVESLIEFAPGCTLGYLLEASLHSNSVVANFDGQAIRVMIPMHVMTKWIESDQVSIQGLSQAGVHVLIEKDFQCLHKSVEKDADAYAHPLLRSA